MPAAAAPTDRPLDPTRCPVCGQRNQCAVEAGRPAAECWCMQAPMDPAALAAIPPAAIGLACLCPQCAAGAQAASEGAAAAVPPI
ncbi:cysteine-rich CWC family protein [Paracidovorax wautersii]|nr:cysteine-rich CWC family protein [Paracidovorax wautersii]